MKTYIVEPMSMLGQTCVPFGHDMSALSPSVIPGFPKVQIMGYNIGVSDLAGYL